MVVKAQLSEEQILAWADAHHARTGRWPKRTTGRIRGIPKEYWGSIGAALSKGYRGLPGGSTLARLLARHRGVRNHGALPPLSVEQILEWADQHYERTGQWPMMRSGLVHGAPGETWGALDQSLRFGRRSLPGDSSLAALLAEHRARRNPVGALRLTRKRILEWADAHRQRTGEWPRATSGPVKEGPGETWQGINSALVGGWRGLSGGGTLAQLLAKYRGMRYRTKGPPLMVEQILEWAKAHYRRTGRWPTTHSGRVRGVGQESWSVLDSALCRGSRGLPGGSTLAKLLAPCRARRHYETPRRRRRARNPRSVKRRRGPRLPPRPRLTQKRILEWADAHHRRTGAWPRARSGPLKEAHFETWEGVESALRAGWRGLPGGSSLAQVLTRHRGVRNVNRPPPLTIKQILAWADVHHRRTGAWPGEKSGPVKEAPGETWKAITSALTRGTRGLPGDSSLAQLLAEQRGVRSRTGARPLTIKQILAWADRHYADTGTWPTGSSGPVPHAPGESWGAIRAALQAGARSLPDGLSLAKLLAVHRGVRNVNRPPALTIRRILGWADAHHDRTQAWPTWDSGPVRNAPGEKWDMIDAALRRSRRGLPGGWSLGRLLAERRGVRNRMALPPLSVEQILEWADEHHQRTGRRPTATSGPVLGGASGESWNAIHLALVRGRRGLTGGGSLPQLLKRYRPVWR